MDYAQPLFSIITVCYNAKELIEKTMSSVMSQSCQDYEYIIKDGGSTDGTLEIIHQATKNHTVQVYAGRDKGIYDAMNMALSKAKGKYVLFMNAGDVFNNPDVLSKIKSAICIDNPKSKIGIYYGDVNEITTKSGTEISTYRSYTKKNSKLWYYSLGACLNHQSMICDKELFEEREFQTEYRVCADREWQMYHISKKVATKALGFLVSDILAEGFSSENVSALEEETEACVRKYCGGWKVLYFIIQFLKKNKWIHSFLRRTEKNLSTKEHH